MDEKQSQEPTQQVTSTDKNNVSISKMDENRSQEPTQQVTSPDKNKTKPKKDPGRVYAEKKTC